MIIGLGIDLAEIPRIAAMVDRWGTRFTHRVFTPGERSYAEGKAHPAEHLAARFAAKEATLKALGVPSGLSWHQMEIVSGTDRRPQLVLSGAAQAAAHKLGATKMHVTLTHTAGVACAVVIAEGALA